MNSETYLNHPTFGLLYKICSVENNQELFTTLYAQRLFFLVTINSENISFEPISRSDARLIVESRLRQLLRTGASKEVYKQLNGIYQRTFQ
ncbi:MAG: PipX family protein [Prochloraceae cyanobacterium]|nr:PipX family protein [Prochloraceae cyanobacterium]